MSKKCHYSQCYKYSTYGFLSIKGNVQKATYCKEHALEIQKNGAFPNCTLIQLTGEQLGLIPKVSVLPPDEYSPHGERRVA